MNADIQKPLKKFVPHFLAAKSSELNEADTVQRVAKFFADVLGYDALSDVSMEAALKGRFVDIVLKVDNKIRVIVEVKAANIPLHIKHTEQAQYYGSKNKIPWVVLTNGTQWHLYRVILDEDGLDADLLFSIDLSKEDDFDVQARHLALLHRDAVKKDSLKTYWEKHNATTPQAIAKALFHEEVLQSLRKQLRKDQDAIIAVEELATCLQNMFSAEAKQEMGRVKIKKKSKKDVIAQVKASVDAATLEASSEPVNNSSMNNLPDPATVLSSELVAQNSANNLQKITEGA